MNIPNYDKMMAIVNSLISIAIYRGLTEGETYHTGPTGKIDLPPIDPK